MIADSAGSHVTNLVTKVVLLTFCNNGEARRLSTRSGGLVRWLPPISCTATRHSVPASPTIHPRCDPDENEIGEERDAAHD
jgi:hypothetical protein